MKHIRLGFSILCDSIWSTTALGTFWDIARVDHLVKLVEKKQASECDPSEMINPFVFARFSSERSVELNRR